MTKTNVPIEPRKHKVSIKYCVPCDYSAQAIQVAEELLRNHQHVLDRLVFVMGSKGVFEVIVDGDLIFSKKALHRHSESGEILQSFRKLVGPKFAIYPR